MKLYHAPTPKPPRRYSLWRSIPLFLCLLYALDEGSMLLPGCGHQSIMQQMCIATLYYVDYGLGLDTNTGASWGAAMKTIDQASKLMADGDSVLCAKSPDPTSVGDALWTAGDRSVVLSTSCTALIYSCDLTAGGTWLRGTSDVTCTPSASPKEGTHCAILTIAAGFTTGVVSTANRGTDLDCSGYKQTSFWARANSAIAADSMAIVMYSDNYPTSALTNVVAQCNLPSFPANLWMPLTFNKGSAIGTVRTIALVANVDPGAITVNLDDFIACKDSTSADSLTLTSLISKNTTNEPWFAIGSINGTAVELESIGAAPTSTIGSYGGATETVQTYKRETIKTTPVAATTTAVQTINDSGADGSPITIEGGYNVTSGARDGTTWYDGGNGYGYGIYATGKSYVTLSQIGATRYFNGFSTAGTFSNFTVTDSAAAALGQRGFQVSTNGANTAVSRLTVSGAVLGGFYCATDTGRNAVITDVYVHGSSLGFSISGAGGSYTNCIAAATSNATSWNFLTLSYAQYVLTNCSSIGAGLATRALGFSSSSGAPVPVILRNFTSTGHTLSGPYLIGQTSLEMYDTSIAESSEVVLGDTYSESWCTSTNHDDTAGSHYRWEYGATYNSTQAVRHTASGWAWQLSPTNTARSSTWPLRLPIGQVALTSGQSTTVTAWMQRSNTGLSGGLVCPGGQITGIAADVSDTSWTVAAGQWEQQSITLQSTETGVVTIEAQCYNGTTYSLYVDDVGCDKTATFTGLDAGTGSGPAYLNSARTTANGGIW